jgi:diguanylate cyclase (GGDEF)-like protein
MLERVLERSRRDEMAPPAVVYLDLDGFKQVNDRFGHLFGDAVLATAGSRLQHSVRPGDVVARLGGDELAVLLTACEGYDEAETAATRLTDALREPYEVLGETVTVTASAGVAVADPGEDAESLLREADAAMYRAKLAV